MIIIVIVIIMIKIIYLVVSVYIKIKVYSLNEFWWWVGKGLMGLLEIYGKFVEKFIKIF